MKNLIVLGSTGSIGTQTLDVVREHPDLFHVSVLVANRSDELLEKQIEEFQPELAVLSDEIAYGRLKERYQGRTELAGGRRAVIEAAAYPAGDVVVTSLMGFAGLVSAKWQAKASVSGIQMLAKRPDQFAKAMIFPAMVETYAVLALLISILCVANIGNIAL